MKVLADYVNTVPPPPDAPTHTIGRRSFLVIARLVLAGGDEHWVPARALRWTSTDVLISLETDSDPTYVWLAAADVRRMILMPAVTGAAAEMIAHDVDVAVRQAG